MLTTRAQLQLALCLLTTCGNPLLAGQAGPAAAGCAAALEGAQPVQQTASGWWMATCQLKFCNNSMQWLNRGTYVLSRASCFICVCSQYTETTILGVSVLLHHCLELGTVVALLCSMCALLFCCRFKAWVVRCTACTCAPAPSMDRDWRAGLELLLCAAYAVEFSPLHP